MSPSTSTPSPRGRVGARVAIMLGILAVSLAATWWLVRTRQIPVRRGAEIIREIETRGLEAFWPAENVTQAFIAVDGRGRPIGSRLDERRPIQGGYAGTIRLYRSEALFSGQWQAAADLSRDVYEGKAWATEAPVSPVPQRRVTISLANGKLHVSTQQMGREGIFVGEASGTAPDNYVPEGCLHLAVALAAQRGQKVYLRTIPDEQPVRGRRIHFIVLKLTPETSRRVRAEFAGEPILYHLDPTGQVAEIEYVRSGTRYTATTLEEVRRHFPDMDTTIGTTP